MFLGSVFLVVELVAFAVVFTFTVLILFNRLFLVEGPCTSSGLADISSISSGCSDKLEVCVSGDGSGDFDIVGCTGAEIACCGCAISSVLLTKTKTSSSVSYTSLSLSLAELSAPWES